LPYRERYRQVGLVACLGGDFGDDGCPARGTSIWDSTAPATRGSQGIFTCAVRLANASAFLELRHKVQIHQLTGRVVECPIDEMNRPRRHGEVALRIPPNAQQMERLFPGRRQDLVTCRNFAPTARNYAAARVIMALAAIHAARAGAILAFQLDDIDLGNRAG
jgi:integrase